MTNIYFWKVTDKYGCFSQWYLSNFSDSEHNYCCAEQYMMYQKAKVFNDNVMAEKILNTSDPKEIKALGRKVQNFNDRIWEAKRFDIVLNGNRLKFSQNEKLKTILLSLPDDCKIMEASPYDKIWGIGMDEETAKRSTNINGLNLLGQAIMKVRRELKNVS